MMYPFMTLDDDTEIVHSDMLPDGRVKVYIERPDEKYGFRQNLCTYMFHKVLRQRIQQKFGLRDPENACCAIISLKYLQKYCETS